MLTRLGGTRSSLGTGQSNQQVERQEGFMQRSNIDLTLVIDIITVNLSLHLYRTSSVQYVANSVVFCSSQCLGS